MPKKEAPKNGANDDKALENFTTKNKNTSTNKLLEYLIKHLKITAIDAREKLGIMNPAQRISELIKKGAPIGKDFTYQADSTGAKHRVRLYIWLGLNAAQGDLFGGVL